ncbi:two-component system sensor histidine kinase/response regulator [Longimonas halophila]|uniref:histidine kinase n=1 Tax=Longimonas halophila TaxID=1469170 RepID=A0A2H3NKK3_9BACT|nr:ATP-binding protein [Longimonas halophila]PEN06538.1 two-component system sensor histidine kinase/response regulator [Longimonas halophila]
MNPELLVATWSCRSSASRPRPDTPCTIVHCNEAWRHVMGATHSPWGRLPDDDQQRAMGALEEAASGALVTGLLVSAQTPSRDEPLPILLNVIPVRQVASDGPRIGAITVTGEVLAEPSSWVPSQTKRHRMETLGRMTMGVAHDLNNLLSGLMGHLELVREANVLHKLPEDVQSSLNTVHQAASDGASLIQKLQRYIRDDTEVHIETLDIEALINDCLTLTQPYWRNEPRRQGITIKVERAYEHPPPIKGVASELREVFVNLILNAVHAMPEGGALRFTTYASHMGAPYQREAEVVSEAAPAVTVQVRDTGMGMDDDVQARIFEPLFTTKGEDGTGLGLSATYSIVQEHNGIIRVDSAPTKGTTFTLQFPCADHAESPSASTDQGDSESAPQCRILVVDDEAMVRRTIDKLLTHQGHAVTPVESAQKALDVLSDTPFDLMFTDFGMPEMNGAELAEAVHARHPELGVVLLSGYTDTSPAHPHVTHVVSKPFTSSDLRAAITAVLSEQHSPNDA